VSDDDIEKARQKGVEEGKLLSDVKNHGIRIGRVEKAILVVVGCIVAAWAQSRGLW